MGSGCQSCQTSTCVTTYSSNCVTYAGSPYSGCIGDICTGDTLTEIINLFTQAFDGFCNGTGINVTVNGACRSFQGLVGIQNTIITSTLNQMINWLEQGYCQNSTSIGQIIAQLNTPITYNNPGCLTIPSGATNTQVIQAIINQLCSVSNGFNTFFNGTQFTNTMVSALNTVIGQYLASHITACTPTSSVPAIQITQDTNGNSGIQFNGFVPPYTLLPYANPNYTAFFDATGLGRAVSGTCGFAIANGNNGTPDMRGMTFSGASRIQCSSGAPTLYSGITLSTNYGDLLGTDTITLGTQNLPTTSVTTTFSSSIIGYKATFDASNTTLPGNVTYGLQQTLPTVNALSNANPAAPNQGTGPFATASTITVPVTGTASVQLNSSGNQQTMSNRQPTFYGVWIMRLP